MITRWTLIGMAVLGLALMAGCYGSTQPATDINPEGATLNAQGTANNGPASSVFEYWQTASDAPHLFTAPLRWPANATGPFSQKVADLADETGYSYRLCGTDNADGNSICAQTRTFTTPDAVEDAALGGSSFGCCSSVHINAHSAPDGSQPRGSVRTVAGGAFNPRVEFNGFVSCLAVNGRRATIGAVGVVDTLGAPPPTHYDANILLAVVDGHTAGPDSSGQRLREGHTPAPDCGDTITVGPNGATTFVVNDAATTGR